MTINNEYAIIVAYFLYVLGEKMKDYFKLYEQKDEEYDKIAERIENLEEYKKNLDILWKVREYDNFQKGYANLFLGMIEEILGDDFGKSSANDKVSQSKVRDFNFVFEHCIHTIGDIFHGGKLMTVIRSAKDSSHQWDYSDSHYNDNDIFKCILETLEFYGFKKVVNFQHKRVHQQIFVSEHTDDFDTTGCHTAFY